MDLLRERKILVLAMKPSISFDSFQHDTFLFCLETTVRINLISLVAHASFVVRVRSCVQTERRRVRLTRESAMLSVEGARGAFVRVPISII
jgi:hypothetical protein